MTRKARPDHMAAGQAKATDAIELAPFEIWAPRLAVVFCGINPSLSAGASGHNFAGPSNRFWRTLHRAGFTATQIVAEQDRTLLDYGCGITAAVTRATKSAAEVSRSEFIDARDALKQKIEHYTPRTVAFLGKVAYGAVTMQRDLAWGLQPTPFAGAPAWILPNPSGLNRNFTLAQLVDAYSALRAAIAVDLDRPADLSLGCFRPFGP